MNPYKNWSEELYPIYHPESNSRPELKPIANTSTDFNEKELIGTYHNDHYGWVKIIGADGKLRFSLNDMVKGTVNHWHYNTYQIVFDKTYWGKMLVNVHLDVLGKISHIDIGGDDFYLTKK